MLTRNCNYCQQPYQAEQRYLNRGQGFYCSRKCSGAKNGLAKIKKHEPNTFCSLCGIEFYKTQSHMKSKSGLYFCSREHQAQAFKKTSGIAVHSGPNPTGRQNGNSECQVCKTIGWFKETICRNCKQDIVLKLWLAGDISVTWSGQHKETKSFVKKYLIETRGDKCEQCNYCELSEDNRSIIQMDHIDGNYQNNLISNLRLLCPNCHAKTETYGARNRSGRKYRKKYYQY